MAQAEILAPGSSTATSTDVVLAAGATANLTAYVTPTELWKDTQLTVYIDTVGTDVKYGVLSGPQPYLRVFGPGTFRVVRTLGGSNVGVTAET